MTHQSGKLVRVLGFWSIVAYGVGDILGAGIYALVGKIAGVAGGACWAAFLVSMGVAALTALSYAELSGRFPKSGGESYYAQEAFRSQGLALFIGWLVLCSGVVSMATVSRALGGYVHNFLPGISIPVVILVFLVVLTGINMLGMRASSATNIVCTTIEITGLLLVIVVGVLYVARTGGLHVVMPGTASVPWTAVFQGGALAFFAFIGFEDMVNVSEEVKTPERTLPKAILFALGLAGTIYIIIALLAVSVIPPAELAASSAPLLDVVRRAAPWVPVGLFTVIAMFAISNTALLNFVMGSRLIYGMAQQRLLPAALGTVHPTRHTPHIAIGVIAVAAILLALSGTLAFLAGTTSVLLLAVFFLVNLSLIVIQRRPRPAAGFRVPAAIPIAGACASLGLMLFVQPDAAKVAGVMALVGLGIVGARRMTIRRS